MKIKLNVKLLVNKYSNILLFIISYIIYFISLEACNEGEELCGNNMKWIYLKITEIIISCEIIVFLLIKIFFNDSSKFHLIHLFLIFILFVFYSHGFAFFNHGMYNIIVFLILLFFNIILILLFKFIIFIFKIKNKVNRILKSFIIFFLFFFYNYRIN